MFFGWLNDVVLIRNGEFVNYFDQACAIWEACCIMRRQNVDARCILVSELGLGFMREGGISDWGL